MTEVERGDTDLTPFFEAEHAPRFDRQRLIREYEAAFECGLIAFVGDIVPESATYFEDLLHDVERERDLHLLIGSPGGDGETALRLLRAAQGRCRRLVVIVPDWAKSAATLIALGAHEILMGPVSDLGPIDPQFRIAGEFVPAKDIIAAVERAAEAVRETPEAYPFHAALLGNVSAIMVESAHRAMERTESQLREALLANPDRDEAATDNLAEQLRGPLIQGSQSHTALFGLTEARGTALPVRALDPAGDQWRLVWRLWTRYAALGVTAYEGDAVYEGRRASHIVERSHA